MNRRNFFQQAIFCYYRFSPKYAETGVRKSVAMLREAMKA